MNAVIGITVRQNSRRFYNKAMYSLGLGDGLSRIIPSFEYCYNRCKNILPTQILTSIDSPYIVNHCQKFDIPYRAYSNEQDVMYRFAELAQTSLADYIIRVTGDDVFTSKEYLLQMLNYAKANNLDYVYPINYIKGCECEVFKSKKLIEVYENLDQSQRNHSEYMSWYFRNVPGINQKSFDLGHTKGYKCELDTVSDYNLRVKSIIYAADREGWDINPGKIEEYFDRYPSLQEVNDGKAERK